MYISGSEKTFFLSLFQKRKKREKKLFSYLFPYLLLLLQLLLSVTSPHIFVRSISLLSKVFLREVILFLA